MRADALARASERGGRARLYGRPLESCPFQKPARLIEARRWEAAWHAMDKRIARGEIEQIDTPEPEDDREHD